MYVMVHPSLESREMELLRQKAEDEKRSVTCKLQQFSFEMERYHSRLAGMDHTKDAMK